MPDHYEILNDLDPNADDRDVDSDNDGLTNIVEFGAGTKANNLDTDGDLIADGYEYNSVTLNPTDSRDGTVYSEEVHATITSLWHTLRGAGGLLDHERLNAYFDDAQTMALSFFKELLLPEPEELPQDILIGFIEDVSEDIAGIPGAAINFGLAVDYYNDAIVVTSMRRGRALAGCTSDPDVLGWEPGYVRVLAVALDCGGTLGQTIATLDDDRIPIGGISFMFREDDEENYVSFSNPPLSVYWVHALALDARDNVLPLWGTFAPRTDSVTLPVLDENYNEIATVLQYTGFSLEDQALDVAVRIWSQFQGDFNCVGQSVTFPGIQPLCPQLYGYTTVHQVAVSLVQVALKAHQNLVAARKFMQGIVDIDPLA